MIDTCEMNSGEWKGGGGGGLSVLPRSLRGRGGG